MTAVWVQRPQRSESVADPAPSRACAVGALKQPSSSNTECDSCSKRSSWRRDNP